MTNRGPRDRPLVRPKTFVVPIALRVVRDDSTGEGQNSRQQAVAKADEGKSADGGQPVQPTQSGQQAK